MDWKIKTADKGLNGQLSVPADKSISHRSVMLGSICRGECAISNFLFSGDCLSTLGAFRALGADISTHGDTVTIKGRGLRGLKAPAGELDLGNSGTTMRIISGILAGQPFQTVLTGDESLSKRPMDRVMEPLSMMGAEIEPLEGGEHAPFRITGRVPLKAIEYKTPMASAQVKSCVLAAGLYAEGRTSVTEPFQSRDHTERMMEYFCADISRKGLTTEIRGLDELVPRDLVIPGDISSASFFIVGALIVEGSRLVIRNVGMNPTRTGIVDVLKRMGADLKVLDVNKEIEPAGDIEVRSSSLKGTVVEEREIPLLIDEIPILALAAARAQGDTLIKGTGELKVKETDRVRSVTENLSRLGISIEEKEDSLVIHGRSGANISAAELDSFGDHRIAMSCAIAGLVSDGECLIRNTSCADISYPNFLRDLQTLAG
ncbi:MAG: 3-phosphoshikimate 1-carboxyvinyltransferase [Candidatus Omnitrophica bacterium]|nr:3-phosphoshikimate 1-carboxyvinyltransferase [Candidatus Omnitrophota bacterium]